MLEELEKRLRELERVAICYSGGIDSAFLLMTANKILKRENVLAIIANSEIMPRKEYKQAIDFLVENEFNYIEMSYSPLEILEIKHNRKDRCYYCKKELMSRAIEFAKEKGFEYVLDGSNSDDMRKYRPGIKAKEELNIISPLEEAGFTKELIRKEAKKIGIEFWDKPANSCLATRFLYDTRLTAESLERVEHAEEIIKGLEVKDVRVRVHGDLARIEVKKENFQEILKNLEKIKKIKELGFKYITLDISGLRSGSFD